MGLRVQGVGVGVLGVPILGVSGYLVAQGHCKRSERVISAVTIGVPRFRRLLPLLEEAGLEAARLRIHVGLRGV